MKVLCRSGRLSLIFERRDIWIGVFVGEAAVFVGLVPCLVFRWVRAGRR